MTKTFCDRCGDQLADIPYHTPKGHFKVVTATNPDTQKPFAQGDLCESCAIKLKQFFAALKPSRGV